MAYTDRATVRAMNGLVDEPEVYPDTMIDDGIAWATARIDVETGTSWEYKQQSVTLDGTNTGRIFAGIIFLRSVVSATVDGTAEDVTGWTASTDGWVRRPSGIFTASDAGQNVALVVTAGATSTVPDDIAWAARTLARWYCLQQVARTPGNALSITDERGTVNLVQAGGPMKNPTPLPDVNAVLRAKNRDHRTLSIG